jgi:plasmid stabilization system protein ParE
VARVEFAEGVMDDYSRIIAHLQAHGSAESANRLEAIVLTMDVLECNPWIGRPAEEGRRELIIGHGAHGYVALYAFIEEVDTVLVLALHSQREAGYSFY